MSTNPIAWAAIACFLTGLLILDLKILHRGGGEVSIRRAAVTVAFYVSAAISFNIVVYLDSGWDSALEFLTGYVIEYSLSVDNIFVFIVIFTYFSVPAALHHRVLMWGIIGAVVLRLIMIIVGVRLVESFDWILLIFGAFLIFTGIKLALAHDDSHNTDNTLAVKLARKILPSIPDYRGNRFFVKENGKLLATPLLTALIAVEMADVMFAVDSIPAVFAITRDPFIIATSNIFAIVGLRSLYFLVSASMKQVHLLKYALSAILVFVGVKMLAEDFIHLDPIVSLAIIASILVAAIVGSSVTTRDRFPK
tara:strand:- start:10 stop:933 length:924 start_codon:yes stop_codon:yes gene_type:complete